MENLLKQMFVVVLLVTGANTYAQEHNAAEGMAEGEIQGLNFGESSLTIQGYEFFIEPQATVEIGGTYGAFTMLESGMMVEYSYRRYSDGRRVIFELRELVGGREPVLL